MNDINRQNDESLTERLHARKQELLRIDQQNPVSFRDFEALQHWMISNQQSAAVGAFGPGKGKTTGIRQFIVRHWEEGIFYAAKTIEELNRLKFDVMAFGIPEDEILLVHSQSQDVWLMDNGIRTASDAWKRKIILTTHERLLIEPPVIWQHVHSKVDPYDLMGTQRTHFIIDEAFDLAKIYRISLYPFAALCAMSLCQTNYAVTLLQGQQAQLTVLDWAKVTVFRHDHPKPWRDMMEKVNAVMKLENANSPNISHKRWEYMLQHILHDMANLKMKVSADKVYAEFVFSPILRLKAPFLYILDATGDLVYENFFHVERQYWDDVSDKLTIIQLDKNVNIKRHRFADKAYEAWIEDYVKPCLRHIAQHNEKCLIITWKGLQGNEYTFDLDDGETTTNFPEEVQRLTKELDLETQFEVTSYLSGKTRATCEFRDCDAVFFLGEFAYNIGALRSINNATGAQLENENLVVAEMVQGLYRSQLRVGQKATLYLSNDIAESKIDKMQRYLANGTAAVCQKAKHQVVSSFDDLFDLHGAGAALKDLKDAVVQYMPSLLANGSITIRLNSLNPQARDGKNVSKNLNNLIGRANSILTFTRLKGEVTIEVQETGSLNGKLIFKDDLKAVLAVQGGKTSGHP